MFMYIFSIIWVVFFAFLAEREFRRGDRQSIIGRSRKKKMHIKDKSNKEKITHDKQRVSSLGQADAIRPQMIGVDHEMMNKKIHSSAKTSFIEHEDGGTEDPSKESEYDARKNFVQKLDGSDNDADEMFNNDMRNIVISNNLPLNHGPVFHVHRKPKEDEQGVDKLNHNISVTPSNAKDKIGVAKHSRNIHVRMIDDAHALGSNMNANFIKQNEKEMEGEKKDDKKRKEGEKVLRVVGNEVFRSRRGPNLPNNKPKGQSSIQNNRRKNKATDNYGK